MNFVINPEAQIQPPFAALIGMKVTHVSPDKVIAELPVREELNNRFGALHGGAVMALADNLGGTATIANLPKGGRTATIESKTNFFASVPGRRRRPRRMHATSSRPQHHGVADAYYARRRQTMRSRDSDADRHSAGAKLSRARDLKTEERSHGCSRRRRICARQTP